MRTLLAASSVALIAAATLSSCAAADLAQSDVEANIVSQLGVKSASCPNDLKSEEGATMTCSTTTADGEQQDVELTVTSVDGSTVEFDIAPVASSG
ncbi:DUF4333 domain-containing protein [Nocardioides sp.]|uniref:DUF4333 domain-containing protein n=1 Tax=Nocardioides sp. TaxID=35761 RepID=UPI0031FE4D52|nr:hypothetical protein [Nocardioides sp.]